MPSVIWKTGARYRDALERPLLVPQWSGADVQLADRVTTSDVYRGPVQLCRESVLSRGVYGSGFRSGWVVTSSKVQRERKGIGTLTINWEVGGPWADPKFLPLDDFHSEAVELYPKVERHPLMFGPDYPNNQGDRISTVTIEHCYQAVNGATAMSRNNARDYIESLYNNPDDPPTGSTWDAQWLFGILLLDWLSHGHETYYMAGTKYSHVWYSFNLPTLNNGGVIEPFPNAGPRMGDASLSWLRLADNPEPAGVNGSVYKITSTWLGGPNGHWDNNLYKKKT
jgi:hypothetical protein